MVILNFDDSILYSAHFDDISNIQLVSFLVSAIFTLQWSDYEICWIGGFSSTGKFAGNVYFVFRVVFSFPRNRKQILYFLTFFRTRFFNTIYFIVFSNKHNRLGHLKLPHVIVRILVVKQAMRVFVPSHCFYFNHFLHLKGFSLSGSFWIFEIFHF